jgi:ribulose-bisphosphate carboxylase large chain
MLLGLPTFFELVGRHVDVPVLAHPSFAGSTRIDVETLIGKLLRLFGGDAVIFANYGGRFSYDADVCAAIAERLRAPWNHVAPAMPVPAGGMTVERTRELVDFFGVDTMLLIGGSLLSAGDRLLDRTRAFTEAVAESALRRAPQN